MTKKLYLETHGEFVFIADFHKIGGFFILNPCLNSPHEGIRIRIGDLIATLSQTNPYCQNHILKENILPLLLKVLEDECCKEARVKALYALSCMSRLFFKITELLNEVSLS